MDVTVVDMPSARGPAELTNPIFRATLRDTGADAAAARLSVKSPEWSGKPYTIVGERRDKGKTEGNRDPFASPFASTGQRKSRLTRTATRTVDE